MQQIVTVKKMMQWSIETSASFILIEIDFSFGFQLTVLDMHILYTTWSILNIYAQMLVILGLHAFLKNWVWNFKSKQSHLKV